ncbi:hypothetical protein [Dactylosporangium sp. CA-233914]|uniref:hypothetical protein n=1 Tax=Dactylosporangium sp. CA-233914 TaxID=3239934 RepID=UPI003D89E0E6
MLYHPGFTRSTLNPLARLALRAPARVATRPVAEAAAPIVALVDEPPAAQLTALDRGRVLDPAFPTLHPAADRLLAVTRSLGYAVTQ